MNSYDFYITPEEYQIAESNGIHPKALEDRIRQYGWSKQEAITKPLKRKKQYGKWLDIALENKISKNVFFKRVNLGWTEEKAATTPIMTRKQSLQVAFQHRKKGKVNSEIKALAESNGISLVTLENRIYKLKWDPVDAATRPIYTTEESTRNAREAFKRIYGNNWGERY